VALCETEASGSFCVDMGDDGKAHFDGGVATTPSASSVLGDLPEALFRETLPGSVSVSSVDGTIMEKRSVHVLGDLPGLGSGGSEVREIRGERSISLVGRGFRSVRGKGRFLGGGFCERRAACRHACQHRRQQEWEDSSHHLRSFHSLVRAHAREKKSAESLSRALVSPRFSPGRRLEGACARFEPLSQGSALDSVDRMKNSRGLCLEKINGWQ